MESNYELWEEQTTLYDDYRMACELDDCDIEDGYERHRRMSEIKRKQKATWRLYLGSGSHPVNIVMMNGQIHLNCNGESGMANSFISYFINKIKRHKMPRKSKDGRSFICYGIKCFP